MFVSIPSPPSPPMPTHIFTYGSLMFPEVWQRVVSNRYASMGATLHGYQRYAMRDDTYPGIVADAEAAVSGLLYLGVDHADVTRLDHFEGMEYRRIEVDARCDDGSVRLVQTYLMTSPAALSDQPWQPETFELQRFLATYCRDKLGS